jgi:HEAT repeat protein
VAAAEAEGVAALGALAQDSHADVRKAAVIALGTFAEDAEAADVLERATKDDDADVRAYARLALEAVSRRTPVPS